MINPPSATCILLQSAMVGLVLTLLALPRMWNDFDHTEPVTYAFAAGPVLALAAFAIVHLWLDRRLRARSLSMTSSPA